MMDETHKVTRAPARVTLFSALALGVIVLIWNWRTRNDEHSPETSDTPIARYTAWLAADDVEARERGALGLNALTLELRTAQDPPKATSSRPPPLDDLTAHEPQLRAAVPALVRSLRDTSDPVRINASSALARIVPDDRRVISALVRELRTGPESIRLNLTAAFISYGPRGAPALTALRELALADSVSLRAHALIALRAVEDEDSDSTRGAMRNLLEDIRAADKPLRLDVARLLDHVEVAIAREFVPELVQELERELATLGS